MLILINFFILLFIILRQIWNIIVSLDKES